MSDRVLKPVSDRREAEWLGDVLEHVVEDGFRVARPVRCSYETWVFDGWTGWEPVEGESTRTRWDDVAYAGTAFHRALAAVPRPSFLDARSDVWAIGDRMAFGEHDARVPSPVDALVARLRASVGDNRLPSRVIHGDLTENVLLADGVAPAIIDFSPYYRPTGYATAIVVVDAIVWFAAPFSLTDLVEPVDSRFELLARA